MTLYSSARALDPSPDASLPAPGQPLLQHLTLELPATAWSPSLAPVARALGRRLKALGGQVPEVDATPPGAGLNRPAPGLLDDAGHQVELHLRPWPGDSTLDASAALVEAVVGITALHQRSTGQPLPLGVDYCATFSASLLLTTALASLVGQARGLPRARVTMSHGGAALLALGQYLAMDSADGGYPPEPPPAADAARPPFTSADGVVFELEALNPDAWLRFWNLAGVATAVAGKGWRPFMQRYTRATAWLPAALFSAVGGHGFAALQAMAKEAGTELCALRRWQDCRQEPSFQRWIQGGGWRCFDLGQEPVASLPGDRLPAQQAGLPLQGITVVECCRLIQGPLTGHLLRLLGATVIKVEPPGGDPMRGMPPMTGDISAHFDAINRGKQCLQIDLKAASGRAELLALLADADVFLHNPAPGRDGQLDLQPQTLARLLPQLIYVSASGTGPAPTPEHPPGTDFMIQAYSGLAARIRQPQGAAGGALLTLIDVLGGVAAAEGTVAALYARQRDGRGRYLDSCMAGAAALLLAEEPDEPLAAQAGAVACRDGWLMLDRAQSAEGRDHLGRLEAGPGLARWCAEQQTQACCAALQARGLMAVAVTADLRQLPEQPLLAGALRQSAYLHVNNPWEISSL